MVAGPDDPGGGVVDGGEAPFVNRGGSSPDPDCPLDWVELEGDELEGDELEGAEPDCGEPEAGAVVESGAPAGVPTFVGSRVSRGGSSPLSIPTGAVSALSSFFAGSLPAGTHLPVAIHGICEFTVRLCSALLTVNSPNELPARSPS